MGLDTPAGTLALDAEGTLHLLELSPAGVKVRRSVPIFEADTWTAPTVIGNRLFLRDQETLRAYDLLPLAAKNPEDDSAVETPGP